MSFLKICLALLLLSSLVRADGNLHVVAETGPAGRRVNLVFLSEGYTSAELPQFAGHVQAAVDYLFSREPWTRYRSYLNIYRVELASPESGTDNGSAGGFVDTAFESGFVTPGVAQLCTLPGAGQGYAYDLLNEHVPAYDIPVVLVNDGKYGGSGGPLAVATVHPSGIQIVEHELGHSFAGLGDEYDVDYPGYYPYETPNTTSVSSMAGLAWAEWVEAVTPVPTPETPDHDAAVGLFEGAAYRSSGWYRPHLDSMMRSLGRPVGEVNRQQFVIALHERVSLADEVIPATGSRPVSGFEELTFAVTPKQPAEGAGLTIEWAVDGVPAGTASSFELTSDELGNGSHQVTATLVDSTPWVRDDPDDLLHETLHWDFNLSGQLPPTLEEWRTAYGPDGANPSGDGFCNLLKYALGLDPMVPAGGSELPQALWIEDSEDAYFALEIARRTRRAEISYVVEVSDDLQSWASGSEAVEVVEDVDQLLRVRSRQALAAASSQFMRLRVVVK